MEIPDYVWLYPVGVSDRERWEDTGRKIMSLKDEEKNNCPCGCQTSVVNDYQVSLLGAR